MFEILQAIVLGSVQGITEFLPISSSGHLQIIPWLFGWQQSSLAFDASLHLGTALAISTYFAKEIIRLINEKSPLLIYILVGNIPAVIIGFFGERYIDDIFHQGEFSIPIIALGLIIFGIFMYLVDQKAPNHRQTQSSTLKDLIILGCAQAVALIPGVSRSGITITSARVLGFTRESATYISFLLGMPVTVGAGLYKVYDVMKDPTQLQEGVGLALIGTFISFVVGIASIKWLLDYVKKHPLKIFVYYRLIAGTLILALWMFRRP